MIMGSASKSSGFSMMEVLVSLLVIVIGVLGMVGLQSKAIPFTQDSVQRNTAIMLADDLVELIRSNQFDPSKSIKDFQKAMGASFPAAPDACVPTPLTVNDQLGCWAAQAASALPGAADLLADSFYVCWSTTPGDSAGGACTAGNEIEIQLAWTVVNPGDCMDRDHPNTTTCTYSIRTRL
jgi:type IV pilus assembly protein PilV